MNESSLNPESNVSTPETNLFGLPRTIAGALIGILFFIILFFVFNTLGTKSRFLMATLLAPGFLAMILLQNLDIPSRGLVIIFFLTSGFIPAIIGSLIVSKEKIIRANGIILLVIYLLASVALGMLVLLIGSVLYDM